MFLGEIFVDKSIIQIVLSSSSFQGREAHRNSKSARGQNELPIIPVDYLLGVSELYDRMVSSRYLSQVRHWRLDFDQQSLAWEGNYTYGWQITRKAESQAPRYYQPNDAKLNSGRTSAAIIIQSSNPWLPTIFLAQSRSTRLKKAREPPRTPVMDTLLVRSRIGSPAAVFVRFFIPATINDQTRRPLPLWLTEQLLDCTITICTYSCHFRPVTWFLKVISNMRTKTAISCLTAQVGRAAVVLIERGWAEMIPTDK